MVHNNTNDIYEESKQAQLWFYVVVKWKELEQSLQRHRNAKNLNFYKLNNDGSQRSWCVLNDYEEALKSHSEIGDLPKNNNTSAKHSWSVADCQEQFWMTAVFRLYGLANYPDHIVPGFNGFQWSM